MKPLHLICCLVLCLSTQSCVIVGVQASFPPSLTIRLDYEYLQKRAEDLGRPFPRKSFTFRRTYIPKDSRALASAERSGRQRALAALGTPVGRSSSRSSSAASSHARRVEAARKIQARRRARGF